MGPSTISTWPDPELSVSRLKVIGDLHSFFRNSFMYRFKSDSRAVAALHSPFFCFDEDAFKAACMDFITSKLSVAPKQNPRANESLVHFFCFCSCKNLCFQAFKILFVRKGDLPPIPHLLCHLI